MSSPLRRSKDHARGLGLIHHVTVEQLVVPIPPRRQFRYEAAMNGTFGRGPCETASPHSTPSPPLLAPPGHRSLDGPAISSHNWELIPDSDPLGAQYLHYNPTATLSSQGASAFFCSPSPKPSSWREQACDNCRAAKRKVSCLLARRMLSRPTTGSL